MKNASYITISAFRVEYVTVNSKWNITW